MADCGASGEDDNGWMVLARVSIDMQNSGTGLIRPPTHHIQTPHHNTQIVVASDMGAAKRCGHLTDDAMFLSTWGGTAKVNFPGLVLREILAQVRMGGGCVCVCVLCFFWGGGGV